MVFHLIHISFLKELYGNVTVNRHGCQKVRHLLIHQDFVDGTKKEKLSDGGASAVIKHYSGLSHH
jgi:hypothetical protein